MFYLSVGRYARSGVSYGGLVLVRRSIFAQATAITYLWAAWYSFSMKLLLGDRGVGGCDEQRGVAHLMFVPTSLFIPEYDVERAVAEKLIRAVTPPNQEPLTLLATS